VALTYELAMPVLDYHAMTLADSSALSHYYMPTAILPADVVRVLDRARIPFVLVGAHGVFGWMQEGRMTKDVDVVVAARYHKKAVRTLMEAFPQLEEIELEVVSRLRNRKTKQVAIDVIKPRELYRAVFKHTHSVRSGRVHYRVPSLEMALAMKFAAMISPNRLDTKKLIDAHDFITMIRANPEIDLKALAELGELVYPGGGIEVLELLRRVHSGETLIL
jgi:hypothetical protein